MIYSATDLLEVIKGDDSFGTSMWAWLLHELLAANSTTLTKKPKDKAGMLNSCVHYRMLG